MTFSPFLACSFLFERQNHITDIELEVSVLGIFLEREIRIDTDYISVLSPNVAKCGPEKLRIRTLFTQ